MTFTLGNEVFLEPELIKYRIALLQNYWGKAQFPAVTVPAAETLQQSQTSGEAVNLQFAFWAKCIPLAAQPGHHLNGEFIWPFTFSVARSCTCFHCFLMEWSLNFNNIFLDLIQLSKQGALQKKKCPSELSAFKKKKNTARHNLIMATFSSVLEHTMLLWTSTNRGKRLLEKIGKYTKKIMFIKDPHRVLQQYVAEYSANFNNVLKQERGIKNN